MPPSPEFSQGGMPAREIFVQQDCEIGSYYVAIMDDSTLKRTRTESIAIMESGISNSAKIAALRAVLNKDSFAQLPSAELTDEEMPAHDRIVQSGVSPELSPIRQSSLELTNMIYDQAKEKDSLVEPVAKERFRKIKRAFYAFGIAYNSHVLIQYECYPSNKRPMIY